MFNGINERSIDVQINRLRKKIEKNQKQPIYLQTLRNKGYIFNLWYEPLLKLLITCNEFF